MEPSTAIDLGRPQSGDVVDLIITDHRRFEELLRQLRSSDSDRDAVRWAFAALHIAHAEAEERRVYPRLRRLRAVDAEEAEHGEREHAEGNAALLAVLECSSTTTQKFDDAVEELARVVGHHLTEEELTIVNSARDEIGARARRDLGTAFCEERNTQIDADCGRLANVRKLVTAARKDGLLDA
ncbi:hemerythrin domain-containing protein [Aeromicrobium sp.]|uniref:hemerythrin domain-containing protein n=1 Tax=Aeromicrobium sp. TaxID=1871063 RepID=UPI003D6A2F1E